MTTINIVRWLGVLKNNKGEQKNGESRDGGMRVCKITFYLRELEKGTLETYHLFKDVTKKNERDKLAAF